MIKQYDELELEISKIAGTDKSRAKELSNQKKQLLSQMSKDELEVLLNRPYPSQYKEVIKKYL